MNSETRCVLSRGNVAVVTGAASGIGFSLAKLAMQRGMKVVAADLSVDVLKKRFASLDGDIRLFEVDVRSQESVCNLASFSYREFGNVNVLFNNAGVLVAGRAWELSLDDWRNQLNVNVFGVLHGIRSFVPKMLASGAATRVVNTGSIGAFFSAPYMSSYNASKCAVVAISEMLAMEFILEKAQTRVSVFCPGPVSTNIFEATKKMNKQNDIRDKTITFLRETVQLGLDPDSIVKSVFDGIEKDRFWIFPLDEMFPERYQDRVSRVLRGEYPDFGNTV